MSRSIDERVVELRFDGSQFQKGARESLNTIDKLNRGLKFDGVNKSMGKLSSVFAKINLGQFGEAIDNISDRFTMMGIVATTTIANITNKLVNLGMRLASAIPNQIIKGGIKRAFNIENARFMLQGLLKDGMKVENVMSVANDSVEGTAYSFDLAAKAAAMFTASGLSAKQLVGPLRAVTGVAAITSSEYEDISEIFTTVAGNGKLMGEQLNRLSYRGLNAAATIAQYFNKVKEGQVEVTDDNKELIASIKNLSGAAKITESDIREMVSDGKINFQIFSSAMDDAFGKHALKANETVTGAFSNIKAALSRIGADFISPLIEQNGPLVQALNTIRKIINEIRKGISPVADAFVSVVTKISKAVSGLVGNVRELNKENGHNGLIKSFKFHEYKDVEKVLLDISTLMKGFTNIIQGVERVAHQFSKAFLNIFPKPSIEDINNVIAKFEKFTRIFEFKNFETLQKIRSIFSGFFAVIDIGVQIISALWKNITPLFKSFSILGKNIFDSSSSLGDWLTNLSKSLRETDFFNQKIAEIIQKLKVFKNTVAEVWQEFHDWFKELTGIDLHIPSLEELKNIFNDLKETLKPVTNFFKDLKTAIVEIATALSTGNFSSAFSKFKENLIPLTATGGGLVALLTLLHKIGSSAKNVKEAVGESLVEGSEIGSFISKVPMVKSILQNFSNISNSVLNVFDGLKKALISLQNSLKASELRNIALAVALLAGSIYLLSSLDAESTARATLVISHLMGTLFGFMKMSDAFVTKSTMFNNALGRVGTAMIGLGIGVLLLSAAMKILDSVSWSSVAKGLLVMVVALGSLAGAAMAMTAVHVEATMDSLSLALVSLGAAMILLATSFLIFSKVNPSAMAKGITVMVLSLASLAGAAMAIKALNANTALLALSLALKSLATAMLVIAASFLIFSKVSDQGMINGLLTMISAIIALTTAASFISGTGSTGSLLALSGALAILSIAMMQFAIAMKMFDSISLSGIVSGLLVFAIAMAALIAVAALAGEFVVVMIGIAAALLLVGLSVAAVGAGFLAIATAINIFITSLLLLSGISTTAALAIVAALKIIITGVLDMVSDIAKAIVEFFTTLLSNIADNMPEIIKSVTTIINGIYDILINSLTKFFDLVEKFLIGVCDVIIKVSPHIADATVQVLMDTLEVIKTVVPEISKVLFEILVAFHEQMVEYIPDIVELFMQLIADICQAIANKIDDIVDAAYNIVIAFMDAIGEKVPDVIEAGIQMVINFIEGTAQAIEDHTEEMKQAIEHLINAMLDMGIAVIEGMINPFAERGKALMETGFVKGIKDKIDLVRDNIREGLDKAITKAREFINKFKAIGQSIMNSGLVQGIKQHVSAIWDKIRGGVQGALDKLKGFVDKFKNVGIEMMNGLANGLRPDKVIQKVANVGNEALAKIKGILGIASPSKEFAWVGRMAMEGLIVGIDKMSGKVNNETSQIGSSMLEELGKALQYATDELNNYDFNPTIRPVVDMSDVWSAEGDISNIFSSRGIDARVSDISARIDGINGIDKLGNNLSDISNLNNKKLLEAMDKQNKAFEDMSNRLDKMQVVLDSGELVGGISSKMDNALGSRAVYAGRMNA